MSAEPTGSISAESQYLLELALAFVEDKDASPFCRQLNMDLLWSVAKFHKLRPFFADKLLANRTGLPLSDKDVEEARAALSENRARIIAFTAEAQNLQNQLTAQGLPSLVRKGVAYEEQIYSLSGWRRFGDIDLFIRSSDADAALRHLHAMGYKYGKINSDGTRIIPFERFDLLTYRLFPDHLPQLIRYASSTDVRWLAVDFSFDIAWHNAPASPHRHEVLERFLVAPVVLSSGIGTLPIPMHFIDCASHLFRDAYFEKYIELGSDVNLLRFIDLAVLWGTLAPGDHADLLELIDDLGVRDILAWSCFHLDSIFNTDSCAILHLDAMRGAFHPFTWQDTRGNVSSWRGTMVERLFSGSRKDLFEREILP